MQFPKSSNYAYRGTPCAGTVVNPVGHVVMWTRTYYVTVYICNNGNFPQTQIPNLEGFTTLYNNDYHGKPFYHILNTDKVWTA